MERLNHHLKNYFIHVETTRLLEELEQERLEMLKTALNPFLQQLPGGFIQIMSTAMKPFEKELLPSLMGVLWGKKSPWGIKGV